MNKTDLDQLLFSLTENEKNIKLITQLLLPDTLQRKNFYQ